MADHESSKRRRHRKSSGSRHSMSPRQDRACACGLDTKCIGITYAFRLLGDPRCHFVEIPHYKENPPAYKYAFRNKLRASYLRHLANNNPNFDMSQFDDTKKRFFVALHHFHPTVVKGFYSNPLTSAQRHKVPISITEHEMKLLNMKMYKEDQILSVNGSPTGGYFFVPSYPTESAHGDLKELIRKEREVSERKEEENEIVDSDDDEDKYTLAVQDKDTPIANIEEESKEKISPNEENAPAEENDGNQSDESSVNDDEVPQSKVEDHEESNDFAMIRVTSTESHFDELWEGKQNEEILEQPVEDPVVDAGIVKDQTSSSPIEEKAQVKSKKSKAERTDDEITNQNKAREGENEEEMTQEASIGSDNDNVSKDSSTKLKARNSNHPWDLSKYRKIESESKQKRSSTAFIDPRIHGREDDVEEKTLSQQRPKETSTEMNATEEGKSSIPEASGDAMNASDVKIDIDAPRVLPDGKYPAEQDAYAYSKFDVNYDEEDAKEKNKYHASFSRHLSSTEEDESKSTTSDDFTFAAAANPLNHETPGSDPTLRIQVHNDLIALESKRRSEMSVLLDLHRDQWYAARDILHQGVADVEIAERIVAGFAKAGTLFAEALTAASEDKFLNDKGKVVKSSFGQNRLYNRRSVQEYSIDTENEKGGQSPLLDSIIEGQLAIANVFDENSRYMLNVILPEVTELKIEIQEEARKIETLGNSILEQLELSENEVKALWDNFDALVTGDLLEYSVHGSMHGGSIQSMNSGSLHGLLSPRHDMDLSTVSPQSSLGRSSFKQLGGIEDGWLVELLYKTASWNQKIIFDVVGEEFERLYKEIGTLEERRASKLHPLMVAFVPRQRRVFISLPDRLKGALETLVGLRIDEESLQAHIDELLRDRSSDRLKKSQKNRSSIMNRSRLNAVNDTADADVEGIESLYGSPFHSSLLRWSKVIEMKSSRLGKIGKGSWKTSLMIVTKEGMVYIFELPEGKKDSLELSTLQAFRLLYPAMTFDSKDSWTRRKSDMIRRLSPSVSLNLKKCKMSLSKTSDLEFDIIEEDGQNGKNFFGRKIIKAVKEQKRPTKCTLRLLSRHETSDFMGLLEKTTWDLRTTAINRV